MSCIQNGLVWCQNSQTINYGFLVWLLRSIHAGRLLLRHECLKPRFAGCCSIENDSVAAACVTLFLLALILLWAAYRRGALKRPGFVTGLFLLGYGLARAVVEWFRQPDAQFVTEGNPMGFVWLIGEYGLTMGQILSLPMIAIGLGLMLGARLRRA